MIRRNSFSEFTMNSPGWSNAASYRHANWTFGLIVTKSQSVIETHGVSAHGIDTKTLRTQDNGLYEGACPASTNATGQYTEGGVNDQFNLLYGARRFVRR